MRFVEILYISITLLLALYGFVALLHTWLYWRKRHGTGPLSPEGLHQSRSPVPAPTTAESYPRVTVQLPIYNERHVAERLIRSVLQLDWPRTRLQVQILDDSTDDTSAIIAKLLAEEIELTSHCQHIHRANRQGYKAGALQQGLASATGELIAIFDADFVAPPDFLQRTLPTFADARVGCVQTRWGHLNRQSTNLTRTQAVGIDGHFVVEQATRSHMGALLNFNGTAGVWRRSCMDQSGGWQGDTLTEDLDLSYRAQLCGWRIHYQGDVIVPAELPLQLEAYKRQQFRWAKGSMQTAIKLMGSLWQSPLPLWKKILGAFHLTNYAVHPLMLANLLLLLPMTFSESLLLYSTPFLALAAFGPPSMYWVVQKEQGDPVGQRLRQLAFLMSLGMGLSVNNTRAVFEAVAGIQSEFKRTPKSAATECESSWQSSAYALPPNAFTWLELALALYATLLLLYCLNQGIWWVAIWILLYSVGYGYVAILSIRQSWQLAKTRVGVQPAMPVKQPLGDKTLELFDAAGFGQEQ
jgi:cellulose synthase/poly-beta-1,6-N-acetylglucosamine synthase-like glycosyltransferase